MRWECEREADDVCLSGDLLSSNPASAYALTNSNIHLPGSNSTGDIWMNTTECLHPVQGAIALQLLPNQQRSNRNRRYDAERNGW